MYVRYSRARARARVSLFLSLASKLVITSSVSQTTTGQGRRRMVPEKYGDQGRQGILGGESAHAAFIDVHQNAGQIRQRSRGRVYRGVLCRVLATGVQQVGAMEESARHGGTYHLARSSIDSRIRDFFPGETARRILTGMSVDIK